MMNNTITDYTTEKYPHVTRRHYLFAAGVTILSLFAARGILFSSSKGGKMATESKATCANCPLRARYDSNPKSIISRIWKWHISWCPGWKSYLKSLPGEDRAKIIEKYT